MSSVQHSACPLVEHKSFSCCYYGKYLESKAYSKREECFSNDRRYAFLQVGRGFISKKGWLNRKGQSVKISIQSSLFCEPQGETKVFKESTDVIKFAFGKTAEECGRMP